MWNVILDALLDSLKVLAFIIVFYIIFALLEKKISKKMENNHKLNPFLGALFGLIPQCGFSVVASDLYLKRHITMGTLVAIFIACSDEAIPIFLANPNKILMVLPLILIKFVVGFVVGFIIDFIYVKSTKEVKHHHDECEHEEELHVGCCNHIIEEENHENKFHEYFLHPLIHSLKIFAYVLVINILFSLLVYFVKEENIRLFLENSSYFTPIVAVVVGLIPNCASSVILSDLYLTNCITFGSCVAGLICNAGLGFVILFKNKSNVKNNFVILAIVAFVGIIVGYILNLILGFSVL
ncbi:MAG: arsenic efflux protein [Erysipelotrichales bacterium]|nr:arsenic efflux protein [Erysipelotrichales bacterium]